MRSTPRSTALIRARVWRPAGLVFRALQLRGLRARLEACGGVDELNAAVGAARAAGLPPDLDGFAERLQCRQLVFQHPDAGFRSLGAVRGAGDESLA